MWKQFVIATAFIGSMPILSAAAEPESIFNGQDLENWRGRNELWRVEDGAITGVTTDEKPIESNTFLIYDKPVSDFDLTLEYRIENGNSGIQYRSRVADEDAFVVGGLQADIDATPRYTGIHYEERGRGILAERGQVTVLMGEKPQLLGSCGDAAELQEDVHSEQWNTYRIVATGPTTRHFINGVLMSEVTDLSDQAAEEGVLALQLHRGPAMKVQFKNLKLTRLK